MLLDTGSIIHLFMNYSIVSNITSSHFSLHLNTNGDIKITNQRALFEDLELWCNESYTSNALSYGMLPYKYRAVVDSAHYSSIVVKKN